MAWMAKTDEPIAQLATRIPKELHRRLKLHCVTHEIAVQDFGAEAIEEKLGRKARPKKGTSTLDTEVLRPRRTYAARAHRGGDDAGPVSAPPVRASSRAHARSAQSANVRSTSAH